MHRYCPLWHHDHRYCPLWYNDHSYHPLWYHGHALRSECCWYMYWRAWCVFTLAIGCSCFCRSFVCFSIVFCVWLQLPLIFLVKLWMVKKITIFLSFFNFWCIGRMLFCQIFIKLVTCKQYYLRRDPIVSLFPLRAIFLLNGKSSTILAQWFIFFKQHLAVALYIHVDIYQKQLCFLY